VRSPNFSNLAAVPEISKGHRVADIVAILSTLDVVIPCIDR
jgi:NADH:ubiquinone oxidoreductase subunit D